MLSVLLKFKLIMSKFIITVRTTAPVLLADYVSTGDGLKMASTAAYNLSDNTLQQLIFFRAGRRNIAEN